jgi:hypothetical protein
MTSVSSIFDEFVFEVANDQASVATKIHALTFAKAGDGCHEKLSQQKRQSAKFI